MPVDDNLLSQQISPSSGLLNATASEFVPSRSEVNGNSSGSSRKTTGAVPKKSSSSTFYNDNRRNPRNNASAPRYNKQRYGDHESNYELENKLREVPSLESRKFFKDNQNYSNGSSRIDANYYSNESERSNRNNEESSRNSEGSSRNSEGRSRKNNSSRSNNAKIDGNHYGRNNHIAYEQINQENDARYNNNEENNGSKTNVNHYSNNGSYNKSSSSMNDSRSSSSKKTSNRKGHESYAGSRNDDRHYGNDNGYGQERNMYQQRDYPPRRNDESSMRKKNIAPDRRPREVPSKKPSTPSRFRKEKSIDPSKISQREQLIRDIESNALECMICCEKIRDHQPTWNCTNCFHIQHLTCIKTWISNSKTEFGEWRCVACQTVRKEVPKEYFCFCGKSKYPPVNRNDLAHSCGEMCGRTDNCQHPCTLCCHPGPHAICQSFIERSCACGKSHKTFQCSMKENFECEALCEKLLNCGVHKCAVSCHQGECEPCKEVIEMKCHCGKDSKTEICSVENVFVTKYSCDKICNLPLSCGNHRCTSTCHPENCGSCKLSPEFVKTCPCGRTPIEAGKRKLCTDEIPLCKSQCSKALKCGPLASPHTCTKPCHVSECPPCTKSTNVKCRCGRIEEKITCKDLLSTDVRCKKKCTKFKTCGKHKCNQNCCIELEHFCSQQCGRMLECKKHRCQLPCHIGNCHPCPRASFDELRCECGAAVVYPPVPCGTKSPECTNKCIRRHKCVHPVNHLCHREPECPPCVFLTSKFCYGKHEQRKTIPCNEDSFSCGMPCGKDLKCGRHKCIKNCHLNECEKYADICKQLCTVKRTECEHNCNTPCHEGSCPEKPCRMQVEVTCPCGNVKEMKSCEQVAYENKKIQRIKLALQMQDGGNVEMRDICGDTGKRTLKVLDCNDECKTLERNRRLDIAFKVENPNLISYPKFVPNYTDFIRTFYKKEPSFVNMVHDKLTELVKLAKESKQKSRSHSFPVMNRDKRHVVHDLAAMFGVETQAYDAEPNRNIVATASKDSCWLPSMSVSEVVGRETGQRQIRPPPNLTKK